MKKTFFGLLGAANRFSQGWARCLILNSSFTRLMVESGLSNCILHILRRIIARDCISSIHWRINLVRSVLVWIWRNWPCWLLIYLSIRRNICWIVLKRLISYISWERLNVIHNNCLRLNLRWLIVGYTALWLTNWVIDISLLWRMNEWLSKWKSYLSTCNLLSLYWLCDFFR